MRSEHSTNRNGLESAAPPRKRVAVIGAGGNIGSHLVLHLARMSDLEKAVLIDGDSYETSNLFSQDIALPDIGERKAVIQARRMRRVNPNLRVTALPLRVEEVPAGFLRADVVLACLDSRAARQYVNEVAWRLGVPWIDSGVDGDNQLARISVFFPGPENPCLECGWGPRDYELVDQRYPCSSRDAVPKTGFSTNAPSHLGALAASLQAMECRKVLDGALEQPAAASEVLLDARHRRFFLSSIRRNPGCLMDHTSWPLRDAACRPESTVLSEVLAGSSSAGGANGLALEVLGSRFVRRLTCTGCGEAAEVWRLERSIRAEERTCPRCGGTRIGAGFDITDRLTIGEIPEPVLQRSLGEFGIRRQDILRVGEPGSERPIEVIAG
ncbi:MAG: ThiF family adenylyltransferase [Candidatus Eisenbacteria bacterium]